MGGSNNARSKPVQIELFSDAHLRRKELTAYSEWYADVAKRRRNEIPKTTEKVYRAYQDTIFSGG